MDVAVPTPASPDVGVQSGGSGTVKYLFGLKPKEMCKLFFGQKVVCPDTTEDAGLSCNCLDTQVSSLDTGHLVLNLS